MSATPQSTTHIETASMSRLTWVLNRDSDSYKAEFQGMKIEIPGNSEKIGKHVRDGGNLMEYLAARKFITDLKQPQRFTDRGEPVFGPKALYDKELTDEEAAKYSSKSKSDLKKLEVLEEKKIRRKVKEATDKNKNPNKVSLADQEEA